MRYICTMKSPLTIMLFLLIIPANLVLAGGKGNQAPELADAEISKKKHVDPNFTPMTDEQTSALQSQIRQDSITSFLHQNKIPMAQVELLPWTSISATNIIDQNQKLSSLVDILVKSPSSGTYVAQYYEFLQGLSPPRDTSIEGNNLLQQWKANAAKSKSQLDAEIRRLKVDFVKKVPARERTSERFQQGLAQDTTYLELSGKYNLATLKVKELIGRVWGEYTDFILRARQDVQNALTVTSQPLVGVNMPVMVTNAPAMNQYCNGAGECKNDSNVALATTQYAPAFALPMLLPAVKDWQTTPDFDSKYSKSLSSKFNKTLNDTAESNTGTSIPILFSAGGSNSRKSKYSQLSTESITISVEWKGLRILDVVPGSWWSPKFNLPRMIYQRDTKLQKRQSQRSSSLTQSIRHHIQDQRALNKHVEDYFQPGTGSLSKMYTRVIVGYNPRFIISSNELQTQDFQESLKKSSKVCVIGICGTTTSSRETSENKIDVSDRGIEFSMTSSEPIVIGRIWEEFKF